MPLRSFLGISALTMAFMGFMGCVKIGVTLFFIGTRRRRLDKNNGKPIVGADVQLASMMYNVPAAAPTMRESTPRPPIDDSFPTTGNGDRLLPVRIGVRNPYVDFVFALDYLSPNSLLLKLLHRAMAARGLSILLVNKHSVDWAIEQVRSGRLHPIVFLDLCSRPGDNYFELLKMMAGAGVYTICHPDQIRWTLKAFAHGELEKAGLPVPPTVILKKSQPDRELTQSERDIVGERVVIKPSYGVAGLGVVVNAEPTQASIAAAREYDRKDDWLIQRMVSWGQIDAEMPPADRRPAYLRAYNVLGFRTLMWWSNERGYSRLTWDDFSRYNLAGVLKLTDRIAEMTSMDFFSSEVAITSDDPEDPNRFVLIDYINDQCDIDPSADPRRSPPEAWIAWICDRLAEFTWRKRARLDGVTAGGLYLAESSKISAAG